MIIVLIGLPGSGKGTQGEIIAQKAHLAYASIGDMFRLIAASQTSESALVNKYMMEGKLIPTELVNKVVKEFLLLEPYKNGCVLDGYPRNIEQAKFLENFTIHPIKVIYFKLDSAVVLKRISGRFTCMNCKKVYNIYFVKPKIENICDFCHSSKFSFRKDDDKETVKKRIEEYKTETYPLLNYYKDKTEVFTIDASKKKEEIEVELDKILKIN